MTTLFITWGDNLRIGVLPAQAQDGSVKTRNFAPLHVFKHELIAQSQLDAQVLLEQGRKLYDAGQFSEAVTVLQQAATAFQSQGDVSRQAIALSNLSLAFKQLGQWEKASYYVAQSLNLLLTAQDIGNSKKQLQVLAQTLDIQGNLQLELGRTEQALDTWKQATHAYAQVGDQVGRTRSQINQAQAQQALGLYLQARATLEQLDLFLKDQPDSSFKATALRSLGDTLQSVGELEKSLKVLQQSREVAERLQSPQETGAVLLSLGNTERSLGNRARSHQDTSSVEESKPLRCVNRLSSHVESQNCASCRFANASQHYQQAAQYYQEAADTSTSQPLQIQAQLNRLSVLLELQKWPEAQNLWPSIQFELTKILPNQTAIYAQINLAQSLACLKQVTAADLPHQRDIAKILATAVQQAKDLGDKRSEAYALGVLGGLYLESKDVPSSQNLTYSRQLTEQALKLAEEIQAWDITYLWQWQLGYLLKTQGDMTGAIAAYTQAVNSLNSLRSNLAALNPDIQFSFREHVEPVYRQFVDVLLQRGDKGQKAPNAQSLVSQKNLKQARDAIESLRLSELENFFREACLHGKPKQIDEVVDKTDTTAAVIYPIILPDRLELILKLPNLSELRHYTTYKSQREVESTLAKLQQYLREPDRIKDVKKFSQQVYSWLIQPLTTELEKQQIKTLVFVLDGYLRNIPMAVLYDEQQQQYLIEKYAIALTSGLQLLDPKPLQREQLNVLIGGVSEKREIEGRKFAPLENVALELKQIESETPRSKKLFNQTFTQTNLQKQIDSASFSAVHIATHGEFSSNPEGTFILTWNKLLNVKDFDTLLRQSDQSGSKAIELLVLSACQTAAGDKQAALGLAGIALRAGARSTLSTLWSVDDQSTTELMSRFYKELENTTVTKAEALRRAQLALLTDSEIPYSWAPYILVGNWL